MSKNGSQLLTKIKRISIVMLAFFPWFPACAGDMRPAKPPFFVPFEAQKAGSTFTTDLRVVEHRNYVFAYLLKPKKGTNIEEAKQFIRLAGGDLSYKNGKPLSYGIAMPLKLKVSVIDTSGERIIYDKEIHEEETLSAGGMGVEKLIDSIELKPGHYRVSVQSLKDIPELAENPITFGIYGWRNSTPMN